MAVGDAEERGTLVKSDSVESRWVYQDDDDSDFVDDVDVGEESPSRLEMDSEDEDNVEQRLIRTGPRVDSFDFEALEVPGAQRNDLEVPCFSVFLCSVIRL